MKINSDIYNEFNSKIYNQDNNATWINPIVQKPLFKIYILFIYLFLAIVLLKDFDIDKVHKTQIIFYKGYLFITLIGIIFFAINKLKIKLSIKKIQEKENNQNKINFKYYRDLLEEYSPGILAFCYNKNLEYEDVIISTLLSFDNKYVKLDMKNKNIYILPNKTNEKLKKYENYLLENISKISENVKFEDLKKIINDTYFKSNFLNLIKEDCKNSSYFKTIYHKSNLLTFTFFISFIMFIISALLYSIELLYKDIIFVGILNITIIIILMFLQRKNSYMKTNKGYEINLKLNGLKNYVLDFSNINNRNIDEIKIWDYYIIYTIILDLKGNLDKEVSEFYKDIS